MFGCRASSSARTCLRTSVPCHRNSRDNNGCLAWLPKRAFSGRSLINHGTKDHPEWRLQTLAIETSCDDTSVAVLTISADGGISNLRSRLLFHDKITANTHGYGGIHPIVALDSHRSELAGLVQRAIQAITQDCESNDSYGGKTRPDFISVTRGPGMRSNLGVGIHTAKGLALAWNIPLVGVHHMQAHALTPRLCATLDEEWNPGTLEPRFPFLGLLVSGGHTMLIDSMSLTGHRILAESKDIAVGDYLDKAARAIVNEPTSPFGKALEDFAFPLGADVFEYRAPRNRQQELERRPTKFGWSLGPPFAESQGREKTSRRMIYSFAGLLSTVTRLTGQHTNIIDAHQSKSRGVLVMEDAERRELAIEAQRVAFEHLGSRILLYLESLAKSSRYSTQPAPKTIVVSGGVASNKFLRRVLREMLDARGYEHVTLLFPPPALCTDNAAMIAWAGMEMFDAGYQSDLSIRPLRKWSMDSSVEGGGILEVGGWKQAAT